MDHFGLGRQAWAFQFGHSEQLHYDFSPFTLSSCEYQAPLQLTNLMLPLHLPPLALLAAGTVYKDSADLRI